jgi:5-methylcytosine-specific restriction protein A
VSTRRIGMNAWEFDKKHGVEYGPRGFRLCRICKTETTYKRATLCSEACRTKWAIMTSPSYARQLVYQRDKGVCAICDLDTEMLLKMIEGPKSAFFSERPWRSLSELPFGSFVRHVGYNHHPLLYTTGRSASLWDADHIVPVVEGGGECDLDNYRTLCIWCHKKVTAELAARRAEKRQQEVRAAARAKVDRYRIEQLSLLSEAG